MSYSERSVEETESWRFCMNQKQIEAAAMHMRLFLVGLSFAFDANYHELEEVVKRALFEVESEAPKR
jgi:hypothetical protein